MIAAHTKDRPLTHDEIRGILAEARAERAADATGIEALFHRVAAERRQPSEFEAMHRQAQAERVAREFEALTGTGYGEAPARPIVGE
jgi:hypothetical protein